MNSLVLAKIKLQWDIKPVKPKAVYEQVPGFCRTLTIF